MTTGMQVGQFPKLIAHDSSEMFFPSISLAQNLSTNNALCPKLAKPLRMHPQFVCHRTVGLDHREWIELGFVVKRRDRDALRNHNEFLHKTNI